MPAPRCAQALTCGRFTVDPGSHVITATSSQKREELHLYTSAGGVYFVMVEANFGTLRSRVTLKQVDSIDPDRVPQVLDREF